MSYLCSVLITLGEGGYSHQAIFFMASKGVHNYPPWAGRLPVGYYSGRPVELVNTVVLRKGNNNYFCDRIYLLRMLVTNQPFTIPNHPITIDVALNLSTILCDQKLRFPMLIIDIDRYTVDNVAQGAYPFKCEISAELDRL